MRMAARPDWRSHRFEIFARIRCGAVASASSWAIAIAMAALMLGRCDRNASRGAAIQYLENLRSSNYAGCYAMLSDQDRKDRTLAEFLTEIPLAPDVGPSWFHAVLHEHAIRSWRTRCATVRSPRFQLPLQRRICRFGSARSTPPRGHDQSGGQNAAGSLAADDFPKITYGDVIYVIKEHRHWHVVADFADRDRIVDLHREAIVEYHQYQYAEVIGAYQKMIADLDRLKFTGAAGLAARYRSELAAVRKVQAEIPAATEYAAKKSSLATSRCTCQKSACRLFSGRSPILATAPWTACKSR